MTNDCITGTYTGTGRTAQTITLGFQPLCLMIFCTSHPAESPEHHQCNHHCTGVLTNQRILYKNDQMPTNGYLYVKDGRVNCAKGGNNSHIWLTADGFEIRGNDANRTGEPYHYVVWTNFAGGSSLVQTGYLKTSKGEQSITLGYQPDFILMAQDGGGDKLWVKHSRVADFKTTAIDSDKKGGVYYDDKIRIDAEGFTIDVANSKHHHYWSAFRKDAGG